MSVVRVGDARLPTAHGVFRIVSYRADDGHEHVAIVEGDPTGAGVLTRLHSECLTGDVLGSRKCDCGDQLAHALRSISDDGRGVVVYLRGHEGRGIGLANKIKAYELQDAGLDTVDANTAQGLPVDARQYDVAAAILVDLGVDSVRLMSNNPAKAAGLVEHGVGVDELVPVVVPVHPETEQYLRTKVERLGHVNVR
jgi:GTP cyclohydrolase II